MAVLTTKHSNILSQHHRILITGGAGFIGSAVIRKLLRETNCIIFNLDKMGYASDEVSIKEELNSIGFNSSSRYKLLKVDLANSALTDEAVKTADPDLVFHLAAESHVDRSIEKPGEFLQSNVIGTFNLLSSILKHFNSLNVQRKECFRLHHVSTDEVFGSLEENGKFNENSPYKPQSPYSASKAASDHLVKAWYHTYDLPVVITNCSNNFGPYQFPEKLIPLATIKAIKGDPIPLYGEGENIRDWLYVEDHVDALVLAARFGITGETYCVGGYGEKTNRELLEMICAVLDELIPKAYPHKCLIKKVPDRPGHDYRYAINSAKITEELGWKPKHSLNSALEKTIKWYLTNKYWYENIKKKSKYDMQRIGYNVDHNKLIL